MFRRPPMPPRACKFDEMQALAGDLKVSDLKSDSEDDEEDAPEVGVGVELYLVRHLLQLHVG